MNAPNRIGDTVTSWTPERLRRLALRDRDREGAVERRPRPERNDIDARSKGIRRARHRLDGYGAPTIVFPERVAGVAHDVAEALVEPQRNFGDRTTTWKETNRRDA